MTPPPDAALLELLALDTALPRVVAFARRFGGRHAELAMHAALPIGLTPELVHLLRINFVPRAPFIAEADLLLSPLCREVGGGMYEMDEEVRELLLGELTQTFGRTRAREVADFLVLYATRALHQTTDADQRAHLRAQQWVALAHSNPVLAAEELADALRAGVEAGDTPEVERLARLTTTLTVPLAGQPELLFYAAGIERLAEGRSDAADQLFASAGDPEREVVVGRVTLPAPHAAAERMGLAAPSARSSAPWVERSYLRPELMLRRGDRGAEVQELQRDLHALGYFRGAADGIFGPQTQEAVGMLQRDLLEDEEVRGYNRGRVVQITGQADPDFLACVAEMVAARAAAERPDEREPESPAEEGAPAGYRVAKVVVVGDIGAGKRSIIEPFERGGGRAILTPTRTRPLWQVPPSKERPRLDGEMVFWDAWGHPHWPVELDLQEAAAVVITVESHGSSREVVGRWLRTVRSAFPPGAVPPVILVGSTARENYRPGSQSEEPLRFRDAAQTERELREVAAEEALHGAMVIDADGQANLEVLPAQVLDAIDWARVPAVESREAYNAIERALPGTDSRSQLAIRMRELLQRIRHRYPQLETAERAAYAGLAVAEARDQVRVLRGFEPVLVDPDLYAALVQSMFEAIGAGEGGLPAVPEPMLRRGEFRHPVERALGDLDPDTRSGLFDGLVDTLLASGRAVRADLAKGGFVVVPGLFQASEEDDWDDRSNDLLVGIRWPGPVDPAYVLLLVHLVHSGRFREFRLARRVSSFRLRDGQRAGIYAGGGVDGRAELNVITEQGAPGEEAARFAGLVRELIPRCVPEDTALEFVEAEQGEAMQAEEVEETAGQPAGNGELEWILPMLQAFALIFHTRGFGGSEFQGTEEELQKLYGLRTADELDDFQHVRMICEFLFEGPVTEFLRGGHDPLSEAGATIRELHDAIETVGTKGTLGASQLLDELRKIDIHASERDRRRIRSILGHDLAEAIGLLEPTEETSRSSQTAEERGGAELQELLKRLQRPEFAEIAIRYLNPFLRQFRHFPTSLQDSPDFPSYIERLTDLWLRYIRAARSQGKEELSVGGFSAPGSVIERFRKRFPDLRLTLQPVVSKYAKADDEPKYSMYLPLSDYQEAVSNLRDLLLPRLYSAGDGERSALA